MAIYTRVKRLKSKSKRINCKYGKCGGKRMKMKIKYVTIPICVICIIIGILLHRPDAIVFAVIGIIFGLLS